MSEIAYSGLKLLDGVGAVVNGDTYRCYQSKKSFQVLISDTATVQIQGSNNSVNWNTLSDGTLTASGYLHVDAPTPYVRAIVSSYASGTVSVILGL